MTYKLTLMSGSDGQRIIQSPEKRTESKTNWLIDVWWLWGFQKIGEEPRKLSRRWPVVRMSKCPGGGAWPDSYRSHVWSSSTPTCQWLPLRAQMYIVEELNLCYWCLLQAESGSSGSKLALGSTELQGFQTPIIVGKLIKGFSVTAKGRKRKCGTPH